MRSTDRSIDRDLTEERPGRWEKMFGSLCVSLFSFDLGTSRLYGYSARFGLNPWRIPPNEQKTKNLDVFDLVKVF